MKNMKVYLLMIFTLAGAFAQARVDVRKTKVLELPDEPKYEVLTQEDQDRILPKEIAQDESGSEVIAEMADNTFSLWWDRSALKQSSIGRAAEAAEKKLNVSAEFEDSQKTKHRMAFKFLAMQALARLEYKGWVRAAVSYDARAAKAEAEISEKINDKQDLLLTHSITQTENKSQLGFRWSW